MDNKEIAKSIEKAIELLLQNASTSNDARHVDAIKIAVWELSQAMDELQEKKITGG